MSNDPLRLYEDQQRRRQVAKQSFDEKEQIEWLMRDPIGRQLVWRLLGEARVLAPSLANNTATVQSAMVAVRDFAMQHLLLPILEHAPRLFLEMKHEHDGSGHATNTN